MTPQLIAEITEAMVATRDESRKLSYGANGLVSVDYEDVVIRLRPDGRKFNYRTEFKELEELADNIESEELQEPLKGDILKDGRVVLNDGERRYRAIGILRDRSPELKAKWSRIKFLLNDRAMTDIDRVYQQINSNNTGQQFDPFEEADAYKDLRDGVLGTPQDIATIALRACKSISHVEARLKLADATEEEKELIRTNKTSPTAYVELTRIESSPEKRVATIKEKNKEGKKHQVKHVKQGPAVTLANEAIEELDDALDIINPQGAGKNCILEAQAKLRAIIKTIQ